MGRHVGSFLVMVLSVPFMASYYILFNQFKLRALPFGLIAPLVLITVDLLCSTHPKSNLDTLRHNGYSPLQTFGSVLWAYVMFFPGGYIVLDIVFPLPLPLTPSMISLSFVLKILINLAVSEITFTLAHSLMHRYWPSIHHMHHCCTKASYTSNYVFHPIDVALELALPMLSVVVFTRTFTNDDAALLVTLSIINVWYGSDHDEFIRLPHTIHHRLINSRYSAYINTKTGIFSDHVRSLVKLNKNK
ncbi:UNVERIFIED_CONTAM: hypothetical protein HDU68_008735 [Siphonaria sp. JEL0065]|nr:hypothetical protein HDU68_008735 [Siphonaria sp. JEL0065]